MTKKFTPPEVLNTGDESKAEKHKPVHELEEELRRYHTRFDELLDRIHALGEEVEGLRVSNLVKDNAIRALQKTISALHILEEQARVRASLSVTESQAYKDQAKELEFHKKQAREVLIQCTTLRTALDQIRKMMTADKRDLQIARVISTLLREE